MTTRDFIQLLKSNPDKALYFEYQKGFYARPDYHITEIKNVSFDTVDCGGLQNKWEETHVQLWENELPEPNHQVNTTKALHIFEAVDRVRPTFSDTEIMFEYGNSNFHKAPLAISNIINSDDKLIVQLFATATSCKAQDRATTPEEKAMACCAPAEKPKMKINLKDFSTEGASCAPGSGCC